MNNKLRLIINLTPIALILLTTILISRPLFEQGLFVMHDDQQVARLFLFDEALKAGQFPVRWVSGLGFGFGYPLFNFYPPFTYFLGEVYHLLGAGFIDSIKLVFLTSFIASALTMYLFTKNLFGRLSALAAAIFYITAPYRALDVYIRGAMAESFTFVWLPLVFWGVYKVTKDPKMKSSVFLAIALSFLMLTHNLIFMPTILLLPVGFCFFLINSKKRKKALLQLILSLIISFGLTAYFWLPAIAEKQFTIVDYLLLVNLASYKIHFAYMEQLWNWPWGYGGSAAGLKDGLSFKIGKLHVIVAFAAGILSLIKRRPLFFGSFIGFLISAFMCTNYSEFIWDYLPPLQYMQFPWRFLTFSVFFSSFLAASLIYLIKVRIVRYLLLIAFLPMIFVPNLKLFKPQSNRPNLTDAQATSQKIINWDVSQTSFEYLPKGITLKKGNLDTNVLAIEENEIPQKKVEFLNGVGLISNLSSKPHLITLTVKNPGNSLLRFNITNFPGWRLEIDGKNAEFSDNNKFKLIEAAIPKGTHNIKLEFKNTEIRSVGNLITLIFAAMILLHPLSKKLPKLS